MPFAVTTPGRVLLREKLPEDLRHYADSPLDKKAMRNLFQELAERHPDQYVDTLHELAQLGGDVSTEYGRFASVGLSDVQLSPAMRQYRTNLERQVRKITQSRTLTPTQKNEQVVALLRKHVPEVSKLVEDEGVRAGNAFAMASRYGFRGNPTQLAQILFGDMLIADTKGKAVPLPMLRGYGEGITPMQTFAGSYGSRKGYCLAEGTMIRMANGRACPIEQVRIGDMVLGADTAGRTFPVQVLEVLDQGAREMWEYWFGAGKHLNSTIQIISTEEHKVLQKKMRREELTTYTPHTPVAAAKATAIGDMKRSSVLVRAAEYEDTGRFLRFISRIPAGTRRAWDLSIDHPDHLFVLANGAIVSNSSVQFATADTGYFAKQLQILSAGTQVLAEDCGTTAGVDVAAKSDDAAGRVLAADAGDLKAGDVLTSENLRKLKADTLLVRSPRTCALPHGVCQKCTGLRPDGKMPKVGAYVGIEASRVLTEPMTQGLALCLDPDTLVRMADGTACALKNIQAGDEVMGADEDGRILPVKVVTRWNNGPTDMYRFTYRRGSSKKTTIELVSSMDHRVWSLVGTNAPRMEVAGVQDSEVAALVQHGSCGRVSVLPYARRAMEFVGRYPSMDLEVDHPAHRFVLANGMIVSNSAKHLGGSAGVNDTDAEGFDEINQFLQVPSNFRGATQSPIDGTVIKVSKAPQGGHTVEFADESTYHIPEGRTPLVKPGDSVYAGDPLSDGTLNPAITARYRGVSEGRRYFSEKLADILKRNKVEGAMANIDLLSRSFISNVRITDPDGVGDFKFGEVVPFDVLQKQWRPRADARIGKPAELKGLWLEEPVAHYGIGTRLTPQVVQDLQKRGVVQMRAHQQEPGFQPYVSRAAARSLDDPDWKTGIAGFYIRKKFEQDATLGATDAPYGKKSLYAGLMDIGRL